MAKNRVAPDRFPQKKTNFAAKPNKFVRTNRPEKNETNRSDFFKPSVSDGPNNFVVKPSGKTHVTEAKSTNVMMPSRKSENNPKPEDESQNASTKKPFDKKKYRLKKYSKKYKLEQWQERRKHAITREYYKQVKDDQPQIDVSKIYNDPRNRDSDDEDRMAEENENNLNASITQEEAPLNTGFPKTKLKPFQRAQLEFQRLKDEKQRKREEFLKKKAEKEEALKKYRREKAEKYKKLSKRTKKGQPFMKDRMEMLLERIQKSLN